MERVKDIEIPEPVDEVPEEYLLPYGKDAGCTKCNGFGDIITEEGATTCQCKLDWWEKQRVKSLNLPTEYKNATLKTFKIEGDPQEELLRDAQEYVRHFTEEDEPKGLYLHSDKPGNGKTHILIGITKELIRAQSSVLFMFYLDGDDSMVEQTFRYIKGRTEGDCPFYLSREAREYDALVLDDLGAGRKDVIDLMRDYVSRLIRNCHANHQPMIITSNLSFEQLEDQFGAATRDRLQSCSIEIDCSDVPNYRRRNAKKLSA